MFIAFLKISLLSRKREKRRKRKKERRKKRKEEGKKEGKREGERRRNGDGGFGVDGW